jgi:serine/threonine-protein kinase
MAGAPDPPDPPDPRIGTTIDGRYRLDERLGAGGMGVVYKGVHTGTGKSVAVKFLHDAFAGTPDLVKRFEREVAAMSRLAHPHLVGIMDSGVVAGVPYLVMEFHSGRTLGKLIERGALAAPRALSIMRQILSGVGSAHANGVVHRDLKPDNVLALDDVDGDFVKILDFGLAKLVQGDGEAATQLTNTGFALGTPGYMAPEQANGSPSDERTDLYAIGVMFYQMVVGRKPFIAESPMAVLRMHAEEPPLPPRKAAPDIALSAALEAVILRALEKKPERRWQSAEAFTKAIDATPECGGDGKSLVDISMEEIVDDKATVAGKKIAADAKSEHTARAERPKKKAKTQGTGVPRMVWGLAVLAILVGVGAVGWSRLSRKDQHKVQQKIDAVADGAKNTLQAIAAPVLPPPDTLPKTVAPPPTDDDEKDEAPPTDTPGERLEKSSRAGEKRIAKKPPRLADAKSLIAAGKVDDAIQLLYQLRQKSPRNPEVALTLGHAYFRKIWRTDALREYDAALALRPSLRSDPLLTRNAVVALEDPTFKLARSLIRNRIGASALPELRKAARDGKNVKLSQRAGRIVGELSHVAKAKRNRAR